MREFGNTGSAPARTLGPDLELGVAARRFVIALHELLVAAAHKLQRALRPAYVVVGAAATEADAVVVPAAAAAISAIRARRPDSWIVAITGSGGETLSEYVDAGAEQVIVECATVKLAARQRAGLRRRGWQRSEASAPVAQPGRTERRI